MSKFHDPHAEVEAALHALRALIPEDVIDAYFDRGVRSFDWQGMLRDRGWSSGEEAVIRAAAEIWTGTGTLGALVGRVDDEPYRNVLEALALRRGILLGT